MRTQPETRDLGAERSDPGEVWLTRILQSVRHCQGLPPAMLVRMLLIQYLEATGAFHRKLGFHGHVKLGVPGTRKQEILLFKGVFLDKVSGIQGVTVIHLKLVSDSMCHSQCYRADL